MRFAPLINAFVSTKAVENRWTPVVDYGSFASSGWLIAHAIGGSKSVFDRVAVWKRDRCVGHDALSRRTPQLRAEYEPAPDSL